MSETLTAYALILDGKLYPQMYVNRSKAKDLQKKILSIGMSRDVTLATVHFSKEDQMLYKHDFEFFYAIDENKDGIQTI